MVGGGENSEACVALRQIFVCICVWGVGVGVGVWLKINGNV